MDDILPSTSRALEACREAYRMSQASQNGTLPGQSFLGGLQCLCKTLGLIQAAESVRGARLPSQMTKDLEVLLGACATTCKKAAVFVAEATLTEGVAQPYEEMWKKYHVPLMALNTCECAFKMATLSLNFVTGDQRHDMAQGWRDMANFRQGIPLLEKAVKEDTEASAALGIVFSDLPLQRYLASTESLLSSDTITDPTPTNTSNIPEEPVQDHMATNLVGLSGPANREGDQIRPTEMASLETFMMERLRNEMISKVVDWKGYNPSTFGPLLMVDSFRGRYEATTRRTGASNKIYRCYLFEKVFIACKITKPNDLDTYQKDKEERLQLKGRVFIHTILRVDCDPTNSFHITYEAIGAARPMATATIFCETKETQNEWYKALTRLVKLAKVQG